MTTNLDYDLPLGQLSPGTRFAVLRAIREIVSRAEKTHVSNLPAVSGIDAERLVGWIAGCKAVEETIKRLDHAEVQQAWEKRRNARQGTKSGPLG